MKKLLGLIGVVVVLGTQVHAQNEIDALRYSQLNVTGTARHVAMGGAFGALGGDMTTLSTNPAGIGVFAKTTSNLTISILGSGTDAQLLGTTAEDSRLNFNIGSAGFVARFNRKKGQDRQWAWKAFHLGVAYNRTNNFSRRTAVRSVNTTSSVVDSWVRPLNSSGINYMDIPFDVFPGEELQDAFLGWETFLIDTLPGQTAQYGRTVMPNYGQLQQVNELTKGSMGEVALSFGGNFGNALYLGATIGITTVNYEMERTFTESDVQDTIADFSSLTRTDYLKTTGRGFNFKLGVIYRPVKWLRVGAAIHTPTFFEMDEEFSSDLVSSVYGTQYGHSTLQGIYDYSLRTPFRAIGSLGFVIGKHGVISADYEYVNHAAARFRASDYAFDNENARVQNRLSWAGNIRVGTEWRLGILSLRGGFALNGNPYIGGYDFNDTRYSLGAGIRLKRFTVDAAYMLHRRLGSYFLYDTNLIPLAETVTLDHNIMMSVGFRF